jgi:hypothetical protein
MTIGMTHKLRIIYADWQWLLGLETLYAGNAIEARRLLAECLQFCFESKSTFHLEHVCLCLAEAALWTGDLDGATEWLGQSLAYHTMSQRLTIDEVQQIWVAARLATAQQQYQRAATLFGVAAQAHSHIHEVIGGPIRALSDAALATVQTALDPAVFAEAFATGQQLLLDEAYATLLVPSHVTGMPTKG